MQPEYDAAVGGPVLRDRLALQVAVWHLGAGIGITACLKTRAFDLVALKQADDTGRALRRKLPVRRKLIGANLTVVSVTLDGDVIKFIIGRG